MFTHNKIRSLDDYFTRLKDRPEHSVYFYRINGYSEDIGKFIQKYYEAARRTGVVVEGKIPNPDEKNLSYYEEIMGLQFQLNVGFIQMSLKKWLPRMNDSQRESVATSIYDVLMFMGSAGKTENMLKNAYIKYMCWLYYKFERILNQLGTDEIPKILYEGDIGNYELLLISILSKAGCDVVLLQYHGDQNYLKLDATSALSDDLQLSGMSAFPENFNLKYLREQMQNQLKQERLYGKRPAVANCTNAWIEGKGLEDICTSIGLRGDNPQLFYNCFCRINGVEDKLTYLNDLYQFQLEIKTNGRKIVVVNETIAQPTPEEIAGIHRSNYANVDDMILDLTTNIQYTANIELQRLMIKAFVDLILEEIKKVNGNLHRLTNRAVYLLCWLKRYQSQLFSNWKMPEISCFIHMGACQDEAEALFLRFLARLPIDVLILNPNLNYRCCLPDQLLFERNFQSSMEVSVFPQENTDVHIGTAAYHAERELDVLMYQDSGIYRTQQYNKANTVTLQTMYEEIKLLWNVETKYRPNFSTVSDTVNIPVVCAKISGVKDKAVLPYWTAVKELITEDTFVITNVPMIASTYPNPMKAYATEFFKNGKVQKEKIKAHPKYPYGLIRDEMQNHMLEKLQLLIDQRLIKGTFENGTEYTIVATIMNLPKEIIRLIQKFDFTKKNPKIIYLNTGEVMISLEDSIMLAYLNLIGFDIVFFVPTGYQNVEKYFQKRIMEEHQIGEYMYDMQVPNFAAIPTNTRPKWRDKIFKRGT